MSNCQVCDLTNGQIDLPGGRIHKTHYWVVEHCVGPLGVGTLIVKPLRHCVHMWELTPDESAELGTLLQEVSEMIRRLLSPQADIYLLVGARRLEIPSPALRRATGMATSQRTLCQTGTAHAGRYV